MGDKDKARPRSLAQKGIQREVYLADFCLVLLLSSQLGKPYVSSGSEMSVWISAVIGTSGFILQWNVCVVSDSSFVGAALPTWSWILSEKNQHTYCCVFAIDGKIVSLNSAVLKCRIGSNFQCLRPPWHLASQLQPLQTLSSHRCLGLIQDSHSSYLQCIGTDLFIQPPLPKVMAFSTSIWIYLRYKACAWS